MWCSRRRVSLQLIPEDPFCCFQPRASPAASRLHRRTLAPSIDPGFTSNPSARQLDSSPSSPGPSLRLTIRSSCPSVPPSCERPRASNPPPSRVSPNRRFSPFTHSSSSPRANPRPPRRDTIRAKPTTAATTAPTSSSPCPPTSRGSPRAAAPYSHAASTKTSAIPTIRDTPPTMPPATDPRATTGSRQMCLSTARAPPTEA